MTRGRAPSPAHSGAHRRGRRLEYLTVGWNAIEALVAAAAGNRLRQHRADRFRRGLRDREHVGSRAVWRLHEEGDGRERLALRLVGASFLLLALYVAFEAGSALLGRKPPEVTYAGIVIAVLSLLVTPWLARQKRTATASIGSRALHADSRQTSICAYLSAILLAGLGLNALFGW